MDILQLVRSFNSMSTEFDLERDSVMQELTAPVIVSGVADAKAALEEFTSDVKSRVATTAEHCKKAKAVGETLLASPEEEAKVAFSTYSVDSLQVST